MKTKKILTLITIVIIALIIIFFWMKETQDVPKNDIDSYEETQPVAVLQFTDSSQPYYLNKYGRIIATEDIKNDLNSDIMPISYDNSNADLNDQPHIDFFERLLMFVGSDILAQNNIYIESVNLSIINDIFEAQLITTEEWQILINSETDFEKQLSNLSLALRQEIENRTELEYVDLRYGENMFYKFKSESI